jgi:hypothetical protein
MRDLQTYAERICKDVLSTCFHLLESVCTSTFKFDSIMAVRWRGYLASDDEIAVFRQVPAARILNEWPHGGRPWSFSLSLCFIVFTSHSLDHFVVHEGDAGMKNCSSSKEVVWTRVTYGGIVLAYNSYPQSDGGLSCLRVKWLGDLGSVMCVSWLCRHRATKQTNCISLSRNA